MAYTLSAIQDETKDYLSRVQQAGGTIDAAVVLLLDKFVARGKVQGWYSLMDEIIFPAGNQLAAAKVKLKYKTQSTLTDGNSSFAEADFSNDYGFYLTANSNKYFATGYIPSANGLSNTNVTAIVGISLAPQVTSLGALVGGLSGAVEASPAFFPAQDVMRVAATTSDMAFRAWDISGMTGRSGSNDIARNGVQCISNTVSFTAAAMDVSLDLLRHSYVGNATQRFHIGGFSFFAVGNAITLAQLKDMQLAIKDLTEGVRKMPKDTLAVFGDSISFYGTPYTTATTNQSGHWANRVSRLLGFRELNVGQPSSQLRQNFVSGNATLYGGFLRYPDIFRLNPSMCVIEQGVNDMNVDVATNGTSATATDLQTKLVTMLTDFQKRGIRSIVLGVFWSTASTAAKRLLYNQAIAGACKSTLTTYVDMDYLFTDMATPATFFNGDGIHPNDSGQPYIARQIMEAINGRQVRTPTLDFPSIAANSQSDLTVSVLNAEVGMAVNATPLTALEAGLVPFAFVSAADTVTVRLTNTTGAAIDPASIQWKVTVFTNY